MSFTGAAAPDHEPEMKVTNSRGQGADSEFIGAVGQEVERPAHCKSEATAKVAAQHGSVQQIEMLHSGSPAEPTADEAIIKLFPAEDKAVIKQFLERYKGSPPNVIEALTALGHARGLNASSKGGNVTMDEEVEEEEDEDVEEEDEEDEEEDEDE